MRRAESCGGVNRRSERWSRPFDSTRHLWSHDAIIRARRMSRGRGVQVRACPRPGREDPSSEATEGPDPSIWRTGPTPQVRLTAHLRGEPHHTAFECRVECGVWSVECGVRSAECRPGSGAGSGDVLTWPSIRINLDTRWSRCTAIHWRSLAAPGASPEGAVGPCVSKLAVGNQQLDLLGASCGLGSVVSELPALSDLRSVVCRQVGSRLSWRHRAGAGWRAGAVPPLARARGGRGGR